jgi:nicotinamidase-related amidase
MDSLKLPVQYWCAVPTRTPRGLVTEDWELDKAKTAFVELHGWNVGCVGGPPAPEQYWVDVGSPQNHEVAWQVIEDFAAPALEAARRAGLTIAHVQPESIAKLYPELRPPAPEDPRKGGAVAETPSWGWAPVSSHASDRAAKVHGLGFMDWEGWKDLDIAEPLKPVDGEAMIVATDEFDAWLRARGIDTLIYIGFCTNLCILDSPASMKPMASRGYRCVLLREATLAVEFPDTLEERLNTRVALRYIESWVGYTAATADFLQAASEGLG